jgi:hypothetical protein
LKYKKVLRELSSIIPLDIIPIKKNSDGIFKDELTHGKIVYER